VLPTKPITATADPGSISGTGVPGSEADAKMAHPHKTSNAIETVFILLTSNSFSKAES
jgi:hypothetical protein